MSSLLLARMWRNLSLLRLLGVGLIGFMMTIGCDRRRVSSACDTTSGAVLRTFAVENIQSIDLSVLEEFRRERFCYESVF